MQDLSKRKKKHLRLLTTIYSEFKCFAMTYISRHEGNTGQLLGRVEEPLHSFDFCPPVQPCRPDQWLSEIAKQISDL